MIFKIKIIVIMILYLQVYYFSKVILKIVNKQYIIVQNDYEMIFNLDIIIELCDDDSSLFIMNFNFVKINEFESKVLIFFIGEYEV